MNLDENNIDNEEKKDDQSGNDNKDAKPQNDEQKAKNAVKQMCEKLLANLIIEDFKISKTK